MRMRKLGKGQSVGLCVPLEVEGKILRYTSKLDNADIDVSDIIRWACSESRMDIKRSMPHWAAQGRRFEHQRTLWARNNSKILMSKDQAREFLENESQTLEERYRPTADINAVSTQTIENSNLSFIAERLREFDSPAFNSASLQEEQERELSPEIEKERQVQRPKPAKPVPHNLHQDLIAYVNTGMVDSNSNAYKPAFESLRSTSAATHFDVSQFPQGLYVTADFASTVEISGTSYISDFYQRPVQWIVTNITGSASGMNTVQSMMIISPHEAEALCSLIRESSTTTLHLYAPRQNPSFRALDALDLYTVPTRPGTWYMPHTFVIQFNLFSGQLYFSSYLEYVETCKFLGLAYEKTEGGCVVAADGFILQPFQASFSSSPVEFLKSFMAKVRRNCEDIAKSHVGLVLHGNLLLPSSFGDPRAENDHE